MIGNDIVDLAAAKTQSCWRRQGFVDKVFTESEMILVDGSTDPERLVWRLWTMKESAYKIVNRENGRSFLSPRKLECTVDGSSGTVSFENSIYFSKTVANSRAVYSIAVIEHELFHRVRHCNSFDLIKIGELPFFKNGRNLASKTHHGKYERSIYLIDPEPGFQF